MTNETTATSSPLTRVPLGARTGQRVATYVLLAVGLIGLLLAFLFGPLPLWRALGGAAQMSDEMHFPVSQSALLVFSAYSQIVLFIAAVVCSYLLLGRRKVAFYVPLAAGFVAAIIFWVCFALVVLVH